MRSQRFSASRTVVLNTCRATVNQGLDGDWRLVSLVMIGAHLSGNEDRVVVYATRRELSDFGRSVLS